MKNASNSVVHRFSTPEFIRIARSEPINEGAREIDEDLVDGDGRLLIDAQGDSARLLKDLNGLDDEPELVAWQRADAVYEADDMFNFDLWQRVAKAVQELVATKPCNGNTIN